MAIDRLSLRIALAWGLLALAMSAVAGPGMGMGGGGDGGGNGSSLEYTAELSGGGFIIFPAVEVTPTFKEDQLKTQEPVLMLRSDGEDSSGYNAAWEEMFSACQELLNYPEIAEFPGDNLLISASGGVRVAFPNLRFEGTEVMSGFTGAEVTMQLIGTKVFSSGESLLPTETEVGDEKVYVLSQFSIWGRSLKGGGPRTSCGGSQVIPLTSPWSTLTIRAYPPETLP